MTLPKLAFLQVQVLSLIFFLVKLFGFLLSLWFVLGRFLEFGYGFVWIEVDSAMAMVSWVLAWWVWPLCFET